MHVSNPKFQRSYEIYTPEAVFHDPVGIAEGIKAVREQFNGLAKVCYALRIIRLGLTRFAQLFPRADIPKFRLLENPSFVPKSKILIDQDVAYYRDPNASSPTKVRLNQYCNDWFLHTMTRCRL